MNLTQIFLVFFLILLISSCVFLLFRRQELAEIVSSISLIFLLLAWVGVFIDFKKVVKRICNLEFKWILGIISLFYLFSSFVQFGQDEGWYLTVPKVYGGDEEHYLLMINSLIKDYDLELRNNYDNARGGGLDAGILWSGKNLDPHANFVSKDRKELVYVPWTIDVGERFEKYEILPGYERMHRDKKNYLVRPHHPPGMPFILSLILWPFRGWRYIESIAIGLITLLSILNFYVLYKILEKVVRDRRAINIAVFLIALGSPFYHYSLLLFKEVFLGSILVFSSWLFLFRKEGFLSGLLVVLGCFTRYSFPIVVIPFFLYGFYKRDWKILFNFSIALFLGAIGLGLYNTYMFSGPLVFSQLGQFGQFLRPKIVGIIFLGIPSGVFVLNFIYRFINRYLGLRLLRPFVFFVGLAVLIFIFIKNIYLKSFLLDKKIGLLMFTPISLFGFLKMLDINMWQDSRGNTILGIIILYIGIYMARGYAVGSAYSAREFVPVIPLMGLPISFWIWENKSRVLNVIFAGVAIYSLLINFLASVAKQYFWHLPIDKALVELVKRWFGI